MPMVLGRPPYSLANLLADMPASDANESYSPLALASLPRVTGDLGAINLPLATLAPGRFEASTGGDPDRGRIHTAFLSGLGVVSDAADSDPFGFTIGNEIKPIKPGQPVRRYQLDEERDSWRMWPPRQLDLFDVPRLLPPHGAPQRIIDLFNTPGLEDKTLEAIEEGRKMMGGTSWYDTEPIRKRFVDAYGHNAGTAAFYDFAKFIAVTSPGSDVGTNIKRATRYFNIFRRGDPMPKDGDDVPEGYGHRWSYLLNRLAKMVAEGRGLNPSRYPKISSMYENLTGNHTPVTVDMHALRLPAMLARNPNFLKREYREKLESGEISMDDAIANPKYWRNPYPNEIPFIEQFYKRLGVRANLPPDQAQAAAWLGGGDITGLKSGAFKTFMEHFDDRIRRTAIRDGVSEEEVWDRFIKGEIDLAFLDGSPNAAA